MNVRFCNSDVIHNINVAVLGENTVQLNAPFPSDVDVSAGFEALTDFGKVFGSYIDYTTIYRKLDDGTIILSNNGSVWIPPEPPKIKTYFNVISGGSLDGVLEQVVDDYKDLAIPLPVPFENYRFVGWNPDIPDSGKVTVDTVFCAEFEYVPTLEEVKAQKISEMNVVQQATIQAGVNVTLTDGTIEHFTLTDHDQTSLMGLQTQVAAGAEQIPWHNSDQTEHCKYYTNADMALITQAALTYVTYHVTYFRDLRIYINALETIEEVEGVTYGIVLPEVYRSEPLVDMYAAMAVEAEDEAVE